MSQKILEANDLCVDYLTERGNVRACDHISFTLNRGEILGIAGESASGKSTLLNGLSRLQRPPAVTSAGEVLYWKKDSDEPLNLTRFSENQLVNYRWNNISIVMQSAMACLNPVTKLKTQFNDVLLSHKTAANEKEATKISENMLNMVGIPSHRLNSYSYELSGGMQQRALIALSLICNPDLVMMDEPTTAVDVIMQRQILKQILALQEKFGFSICFVTHDLSLLLEIADKVIIMYAGKIVEMGSAKQIYSNPIHPYTRGLRNAYPSLTEKIVRKTGIPGDPPDLLDLPFGCPFAPRCDEKIDICSNNEPELLPVKTAVGQGLCRCFVREKGVAK
jgi:peptide/nickel transport system ATP-binding protein